MLEDFGQITWGELDGYLGSAQDVISDNIVNVYQEAVQHVNELASDVNLDFLDEMIQTRNDLVTELNKVLEVGSRKKRKIIAYDS